MAQMCNRKTDDMDNAVLYRVSIKSFPHYKHLLQENYVEYKHNFNSDVWLTVHREKSMKRVDQQDATITFLLLTSVSTCFGHHYVHLQEKKRPCYCIWCGILVLLDVVGSGCGALSCRM